MDVPSPQTIPTHKLEEVSRLAQKIAVQLTEGSPIHCDFTPGNGSKYSLLLIPLDCVIGKSYPKKILVHLVDACAAHAFSLTYPICADSIKEKLSVSESDSLALSYFLSEIAHFSNT